jgi:hypothetical protein
MTRLYGVLGLGRLAGWGSQQVARSNAAAAAALLMRQRQEREDVDAYVAHRLGAPTHPGAEAPARTGTEA